MVKGHEDEFHKKGMDKKWADEKILNILAIREMKI